MKATAATFLILVMSATAAFGPQQKVEWIKYDSPEGRYSILFPGKPEVSKQDAPAHSGQTLIEYFATYADPTPATDVAYISSYFDLAPGMKYSIDIGRDGYLKSVNATLQSEKPVMLGTYSGREVRATASKAGEDFTMIARFYIIENRVYLIQYLFAKPYDATRAEKECAKFFDSFTLTSAH